MCSCFNRIWGIPPWPWCKNTSTSLPRPRPSKVRSFLQWIGFAPVEVVRAETRVGLLSKKRRLLPPDTTDVNGIAGKTHTGSRSLWPNLYVYDPLVLHHETNDQRLQHFPAPFLVNCRNRQSLQTVRRDGGGAPSLHIWIYSHVIVSGVGLNTGGRANKIKPLAQNAAIPTTMKALS